MLILKFEFYLNSCASYISAYTAFIFSTPSFNNNRIPKFKKRARVQSS